MSDADDPYAGDEQAVPSLGSLFDLPEESPPVVPTRPGDRGRLYRSAGAEGPRAAAAIPALTKFPPIDPSLPLSPEAVAASEPAEAVPAAVESVAEVTPVTVEPVAEVPAEPIAEVPAEPIAEVPAEPVAEVPAEPVAEVPAEPVAEAAPVTAEPVAEVPAEPAEPAAAPSTPASPEEAPADGPPEEAPADGPPEEAPADGPPEEAPAPAVPLPVAAVPGAEASQVPVPAPETAPPPPDGSPLPPPAAPLLPAATGAALFESAPSEPTPIPIVTDPTASEATAPDTSSAPAIATIEVEPGGHRPGWSWTKASLIIIGVTVAAAFIDVLVRRGIGTITGVALLVVAVVAALRLSRADIWAAVVMPPLAFLLAVLTAGQLTAGTSGGFLSRQALTILTGLSLNAMWILGATAVAFVIVMVRRYREGPVTPKAPAEPAANEESVSA